MRALGQPAARRGSRTLCTVLSKSLGIAVDDPCHPWRAAVISPPLCDAVELRDGRSQRLASVRDPDAPPQRDGRRAPPAGSDSSRPPNRWAGPARKCECPAGLTGDGHDAAVDGRCGAPIEAHLGVTHRATPFNRREIEVIELGRLASTCRHARPPGRRWRCVCRSARQPAVPCAEARQGTR